MPDPIYTVGHSVRELAAVLDLLRLSAITVLFDVRRYPASRRHPQFGREALAPALAAAGVAYEHAPDLGGRRHPRPGSVNTAWRQPGFRGYADYMATNAFREALARLRTRAAEASVAVMCAEAVPWRCHRQLIADALLVHGHRVVHILGPGQLREHTFTPGARAGPEGVLVYPGQTASQKDLFTLQRARSSRVPEHRARRRPR
jgi:uncharacterized protein (DUF488 family)